MRILLSFLLITLAHNLRAQELYVFTEPASNMPSKTIGLRLNQEGMGPYKNANQGINNTGYMYRLNPEVMLGINKYWMVHLNGYASNMQQPTFRPEAVSLYAKYRFLSVDDVHRHFRMAAYAKAARSNNAIQYAEINLNGDNSGAAAGLVVTQLLHKVAISFTGGYARSINNVGNELAAGQPRYGLNYALSVGYLALPVTYRSYSQPNFNVYAELLGKTNPATGQQYIDIAPAVQVILLSRMRIDLGFRQQISGNMARINTRSALLRFEYNIFNAYK